MSIQSHSLIMRGSVLPLYQVNVCEYMYIDIYIYKFGVRACSRRFSFFVCIVVVFPFTNGMRINSKISFLLPRHCFVMLMNPSSERNIFIYFFIYIHVHINDWIKSLSFDFSCDAHNTDYKSELKCSTKFSDTISMKDISCLH